MTETYVTVIRGSELRSMRENKGMTVRGLAKASGVNYGTISRLEGSSGVRTSIVNLNAIARALSVDVSRLKDVSTR